MFTARFHSRMLKRVILSFKNMLRSSDVHPSLKNESWEFWPFWPGIESQRNHRTWTWKYSRGTYLEWVLGKLWIAASATQITEVSVLDGIFPQTKSIVLNLGYNTIKSKVSSRWTSVPTFIQELSSSSFSLVFVVQESKTRRATGKNRIKREKTDKSIKQLFSAFREKYANGELFRSERERLKPHPVHYTANLVIKSEKTSYLLAYLNNFAEFCMINVRSLRNKGIKESLELSWTDFDDGWFLVYSL